MAKKTLPLVKIAGNYFTMAAKISTPHPAEEHCRARQTGNFCFSHCS
ncbi:MAG: hypothetical protein M3R36_15315 [Bacteroidota bacterium]|nr:hypothetical protein [Bacteroidota bacterium]